MLGAGNSTKSTVFKQFNCAYSPSFRQPGWTEDDRRGYVHTIRNNIMLGLHCLAEFASLRHQSNYAAHRRRMYPDVKHIDDLKNVLDQGPKISVEGDKACNALLSIDEIDSSTVTKDNLDDLVAVWNDPLIQHISKYYSHPCIFENTAYYMAKIHKIVSPKYLPSDEDILYARVRTTGIVENQVNINSSAVSLYETGCQRNERFLFIVCVLLSRFTKILSITVDHHHLPFEC